MASFKSLEMADAVSSKSHIEVKKALFGLIQKAVYTPTQSPLKVIQQDYTTEAGDRLKRILNADDSKLEATLQNAGIISPSATGPFRIEALVSADKQFAAVQTLGYSDFQYKPTSDVRFFEGKQAELIATLF